MVKDWKHTEWGFRGTDTAGVICQICRTKKQRGKFKCTASSLGHIVYMQIHRKFLRGDWIGLVCECPCCGATEIVNRSRHYASAESLIDKVIPWNTRLARIHRKAYLETKVWNPALQKYEPINKQTPTDTKPVSSDKQRQLQKAYAEMENNLRQRGYL